MDAMVQTYFNGPDDPTCHTVCIPIKPHLTQHYTHCILSFQQWLTFHFNTSVSTTMPTYHTSLYHILHWSRTTQTYNPNRKKLAAHDPVKLATDVPVHLLEKNVRKGHGCGWYATCFTVKHKWCWTKFHRTSCIVCVCPRLMYAVLEGNMINHTLRS